MKYSFNDIDERIIKTRIALSDAIFEILKKNNIIKVLDVCKQANITPMTYYHHFNNKHHLLEFAIKKQLENQLPIPLKLRPQNMRQLVAYLLKMNIAFVKDNYDVIVASLNKLNNHNFNSSYLAILLNMHQHLIAQEIKNIYPDINTLTINTWSTILTYGLLLFFIHNIKFIKHYQFVNMWNSLKLFWNKI